MSIVSNHFPETIDQLNGRGPDCGHEQEAERHAAYVPTAADLADMARHHALAHVDLTGLEKLAKSLDGVATGCRADAGSVSDGFHRGFCNGQAAAYENAGKWIRQEIEAIKS
jgi:hypothetical protein